MRCVAVAEGVRVAVHEWGDERASALVLLHGGGLSSAEWT
jgi:pimeloyl-ACP methyl ester carboxylesterase